MKFLKLNLKKYQCPCCGNYTFYEKLTWTNNSICEVCFWQNDLKAYQDLNSKNNANNISLNDARENYLSVGASRVIKKKYCRESNYADKVPFDLVGFFKILVFIILIIMFNILFG